MKITLKKFGYCGELDYQTDNFRVDFETCKYKDIDYLKVSLYKIANGIPLNHFSLISTTPNDIIEDCFCQIMKQIKTIIETKEYKFIHITANKKAFEYAEIINKLNFYVGISKIKWGNNQSTIFYNSDMDFNLLQEFIEDLTND